MNWIYGIVIITLIALYMTTGRESSSVTTQTSYSEFKTLVMKGYANEIVVLQKGQIIERGKHDDLIALGGVYKKLTDLQSIG